MQVVYRKQAIDFQRRRLAGDVSVLPRRGIVVVAAMVMVAMTGAGIAAWGWSIDVDRDVACGLPASGSGLILDEVSLPRGARLSGVDQQRPVSRRIDADDVIVERNAKVDPGCLATVHLAVHPVREAIVRAFRR